MTLQFIFDPLPSLSFVIAVTSCSLRRRWRFVLLQLRLTQIQGTLIQPHRGLFVPLLRYHCRTPVWRSSIRQAQSHDSATRGRLHRAVLHSMLFYYSVVFSVEVLTWLRLNSIRR
jgi:hypothetical protein